MNTVGRQEANSLPWLEFELPVPPSVNRFKRRLGNKSPNVQDWIRQADMAWMAQEPGKRGQRCCIKCKFEAEFLFGRNNRADFHNFEKPLFDWLQSREFIENDKLCEWRSSGWSDAVMKGRVLVKLRRVELTKACRQPETAGTKNSGNADPLRPVPTDRAFPWNG